MLDGTADRAVRDENVNPVDEERRAAQKHHRTHRSAVGRRIHSHAATMAPVIAPVRMTTTEMDVDQNSDVGASGGSFEPTQPASTRPAEATPSHA